MEMPGRTIHTETEMHGYEGYLPDEWCNKIVGLVPDGTVIDRVFLDLLMSWRSTAYTAQMPATAVRALHAATLGRGNFVSPDRSIVAYSDQIIQRLTQRVPELMDDRPLRATLVAELAMIASEFRDRAASVQEEYPIQPIWNHFMGDVAFRISLWASQRVAFVAFYNAYEGFLLDTLKVGTGLPSLRSTDKKVFNEALRTALGKDVSGPCWSHHEINIARLVRHALSHNGGRETVELRSHKHGVKLFGDALQIVPEDNHRMLRRLRLAVEEIIRVTIGSTKFIAPLAVLPPSANDQD
jgi:hypothetical protein